MNTQVPILILSDSPDQSSGLARIARDLATLISSMPEFVVATLGLGGTGSRFLPWQQYQMGMREFGELSLPAVWEDFSGGRPGIVLTIFDLARILWLCQPKYAGGSLQKWLEHQRRSGMMKVWSYLPIDSTGPNDQLTGMAREVLLGADRLLAYTPWAQDIVSATIGPEESAARNLQWMPHAINTRIFNPVPTTRSTPRIGCVMTNQLRKDWGTVAQICAEMTSQTDGKIEFWWHSDVVERHWNLQALIEDFRLTGLVECTFDNPRDGEMAERYRKCSMTILPSCEGFGYPIFESLACGVPCLHTNYAGGASLLSAFGLKDLLVNTYSCRLDTVHNFYRPVQSFSAWIRAIAELPKKNFSPDDLFAQVSHLDMKYLGHRWKQWIMEGVRNA